MADATTIAECDVRWCLGRMRPGVDYSYNVPTEVSKVNASGFGMTDYATQIREWPSGAEQQPTELEVIDYWNANRQDYENEVAPIVIEQTRQARLINYANRPVGLVEIEEDVRFADLSINIIENGTKTHKSLQLSPGEKWEHQGEKGSFLVFSVTPEPERTLQVEQSGVSFFDVSVTGSVL